MSIGHRNQHRCQCHRSFACADIALQQSIHRPRVGEIARDLMERAQLIGSEREGKARENRLLRALAHRQRGRSLRGAHASLECDGQLQREQLVIRQSGARYREVCFSFGRVHRAIRRAQCRQSALGEKRHRQRILDRRACCIKHFGQGLLDETRGQRFTRRVNRAHAISSRGGVVTRDDFAPLGIDDLEVTAFEFGFSLDDSLSPRMQFAAHPRHVEEDQTRRACAIIKRRFDAWHPTKRAARSHDGAAHRDVHRLLSVGFRLDEFGVRGDRIFALFRLDAEREMHQQVSDGVDVERGKSAAPRRGHARDGINAGRENVSSIGGQS